MPRKSFTSNSGPNAEDRAIELWADLLIDKLNKLSKDAKWEQPWFSDKAMGWPINMSGRPYAGNNSVILKMLCEKNQWELPVFATYNRLTSLNYQMDPTKGPLPLRDKDGENLPRVLINKGEKSVPVMLTSFTVVNKDTKEKIPYEEYRELSNEEQKNYNVFPHAHVYNVFNVAGQTNLRDVRPEVYEKLKEMCNVQRPQKDREMWSLPEFDAMVKEQKWICPIDIKDEDKCFYSISRDRIQMVPAERFKNGESYFSNTLHEMSHSSTSIFNRIDTAKFGNEEYAKEELHAEISAALVASKYHASKNLKSDTLPYIKSWLDSLQKDPSFIKVVLNDVKRSSGLIMQHLEEMKLELDQRKDEDLKQDGSKEENTSQEAKPSADKSAVVAAKATPESPKEEQEEEVHRGFRR